MYMVILKSSRFHKVSYILYSGIKTVGTLQILRDWIKKVYLKLVSVYAPYLVRAPIDKDKKIPSPAEIILKDFNF